MIAALKKLKIAFVFSAALFYGAINWILLFLIAYKALFYINNNQYYLESSLKFLMVFAITYTFLLFGVIILKIPDLSVREMRDYISKHLNG